MNRAGVFFAISFSILLVDLAAVAAEIPEAKPTAYLAAYFWEKRTADKKEDSQLYYAISRDGFKFSAAVNKAQPILRSTMDDQVIRDPMIMRDPDGKSFHLIATVSWKNRPFTIWDSTDLIHWTGERLIDCAPENATKTWAPELLWDPETKQYVAYWTGDVNNDWNTACIRYATSKDLKTFSTPGILMKEQGGCLDADIIHADGKWRMVYRYKGIWMRTADHALGPYENPVKILDLNVEGPAFFPINGRNDQWGLIFDYFGGNQGRWGIATSSNFTDWTLVTRKEWPYYTPEVFLPPGVRHGSVLPITNAEADAILNALGSTTYNHEGKETQ